MLSRVIAFCITVFLFNIVSASEIEFERLDILPDSVNVVFASDSKTINIDIDSDCDFDKIELENGAIKVLRNIKIEGRSHLTPIKSVPKMTDKNLIRIYKAFINGDKYPDIIATGDSGHVHCFLNISQRRDSVFEYNPGVFANILDYKVDNIAINDFDRDGDSDLFVDSSGAVIAYRNLAIDYTNLLTWDEWDSFYIPSLWSANTGVRFFLNQDSPIKLEIYNLAGQKIKFMDLGLCEKGLIAVSVDVDGMEHGIYIVKAITDQGNFLKRMKY